MWTRGGGGVTDRREDVDDDLVVDAVALDHRRLVEALEPLPARACSSRAGASRGLAWCSTIRQLVAAPPNKALALKQLRTRAPHPSGAAELLQCLAWRRARHASGKTTRCSRQGVETARARAPGNPIALCGDVALCVRGRGGGRDDRRAVSGAVPRRCFQAAVHGSDGPSHAMRCA